MNPTQIGRPRLAVVAMGTLVLIATIAAVLLLPGKGPEPAAAQTVGGQPNIIVLLTDDQESRSMRVMKITAKKLKRNGVTLKRYYDNFPLCCPARTTLFTGQYAHNHHVLSNVPPDGGYGTPQCNGHVSCTPATAAVCPTGTSCVTGCCLPVIP